MFKINFFNFIDWRYKRAEIKFQKAYYNRRKKLVTDSEKAACLPALLGAISRYRMLYLAAKKEILLVAKERDEYKDKLFLLEREVSRERQNNKYA